MLCLYRHMKSLKETRRNSDLQEKLPTASYTGLHPPLARLFPPSSAHITSFHIKEAVISHSDFCSNMVLIYLLYHIDVLMDFLIIKS